MGTIMCHATRNPPKYRYSYINSFEIYDIIQVIIKHGQAIAIE